MSAIPPTDGCLSWDFDRLFKPQFTTGRLQDGGRIRISARGDVDLATRDMLTAVGLDALRAATVREVVIDLADVTFMDASGLGALITIHNFSLRRGKRLVLSAVPTRIASLLEISGLYGHFTIAVTSVEHALQPRSPGGLLGRGGQ